MLHAAEFTRDLADAFDADVTPHGADRRHIILNIVHTGNLDVADVENIKDLAVLRILDGVAVKVRAVTELFITGEKDDLSLTAQIKQAGDLVIVIQNRLLIFILIKNYISLCFYVLVHVLVNVEVVWREVGHDRDVGTLAHGDQLEGAQLHDAHIIGRDSLDLRQEGLADIAADMDGITVGSEHFGDNGGGRCLAVGAGHRVDLARTDIEEDLHLGADGHAFLTQGVELVTPKRHTGGAQRDIDIDIVKVVFA